MQRHNLREIRALEWSAGTDVDPIQAEQAPVQIDARNPARLETVVGLGPDAVARRSPLRAPRAEGHVPI